MTKTQLISLKKERIANYKKRMALTKNKNGFQALINRCEEDINELVG